MVSRHNGQGHGILDHPVLGLAVADQGRGQSHAGDGIEQGEFPGLAVAIIVFKPHDGGLALLALRHAGHVIVAPGLDTIRDIKGIVALKIENFDGIDNGFRLRVNQRYPGSAAIVAAPGVFRARLDVIRIVPGNIMGIEHPQHEGPMRVFA